MMMRTLTSTMTTWYNKSMNNIKQELMIIGYITTLAATAAFGVTHASPTPAPAPRPATVKVAQLPNLVLPPCKTEDSNNCYWDAKKMGNHRGNSFITWNGKTYYAK